MWKMMNYKTPEDWVLATGETHTVREFVEKAFKFFDLDWENFVLTSEKYFRPNEVNYLLGNPSKAKAKLDWSPKCTFEELIEKMLESDLALAKQEKVLLENNLIKPTWEYPTNQN